jgi:hypothetical protein
MLFGSTNPAIRDVRFVGITGRVTGDGDCIRIQNRRPQTGTRTNKPIERVTFRDIAVSHSDVEAYAVAIENGRAAKAPLRARSMVRFEPASGTRYIWGAVARPQKSQKGHPP